MNPKQENIVAIDISKDTLEVLAGARSFTVTYKAKGLAELFEHIEKLSSALVVCEATGGYERKLVAELTKRNVAFAVLNPARVRAFAKSEGVKAKTDAMDTRMIQRFAVEKNVQACSPLEPKRQELAELMDRRSHLAEHLSREKNRLQNSSPSIHDSIERMIAAVTSELKVIEKQIRQLVASDAKMDRQARVALSVSGVGEVTAWTLLAYLSEIDSLTRNQVVALAGIAPFNDDSGKTVKKRRIQEGRAKVRRCLYMATQTAAIHNEVIKPYVADLRARGKPYKCAIVAGMRKMLIHIQSLIKKQDLILES